MSKKFSIMLCAVCLLTLGSVTWAQNDPTAITGMPNFGAQDSHQYDTVDLMSNTVTLNVPIRTKNGAMSMLAGMAANSGMQTDFIGSTLKWEPMMWNYNQPFPGAPFFVSINGATLDGGQSGVGFNVYPQTAAVVSCGGHPTNQRYSNWVVASAAGTIHKLPSSFQIDDFSTSGCLTTATGITIDNSGWTASVSNTGTVGVWVINSLTHKDGKALVSAGFSVPGTGTLTDRNGNVITANVGAHSTTYTDSMGQTALTFDHSIVATNKFSWPTYLGTVFAYQGYTSHPIATNFACGGTYPADILTTDNKSGNLTDSFTFADSTVLGLTYEATPGHAGYTTGRLDTITLPTGGTIRYTYPGSGINCATHTPQFLTRTLGNGDVTTYTLTYSTGYATNTVLSAAGAKSIYYFTGFTTTGANPLNAQLLIEDIKYNGNTGILLDKQDFYCYNSNATAVGCLAMVNGGTILSQAYTYPITARAHLISLDQSASTGKYSAEVETYDSYGNVTDRAVYDYASSFTGATPLHEELYSYGSWNGSGCTFATGAVRDKVCQIVVKEEGNIIAETTFTYNTTTWDLLKMSKLVLGSTFVGNTTNNTYNTNGTPLKTYDLDNNETDYTYSSAGYSHCTGCTQYPFPTQIKNAGTGNYTNFTYYGDGGVVATEADRNGATKTYSYASTVADPYWRPLTITDPSGAVQTNDYPNGTGSTANTSSSLTTFNSGNSITGHIYTVDGYGRLIRTQTPQSPTGSNYDTVSSAYSFGSGSVRSSNATPCSTTLGSDCSPLNYAVTTDNLGRVTNTTHGTGTETTTHVFQFSGNDDMEVVTLTPAPTGENQKQSVIMRDGAGRTVSTCNVGAGYTASCGATGFSGVVNNYAYSVFPTCCQSQVKITRKESSTDTGQSKYITRDGMNRTNGFYSPELSGNHDLQQNGINTNYDLTYVQCLNTVASAGDLTCKTDNINYTTYLYDTQHRVTDMLYGAFNGVTPGPTTFCKRFRYDNSTGVLGTRPTGVTLSNQYGRLVEAETDDCTTPLTAAHQLSDEWFAYDANGNKKDIWQWSPHSSGYLHTSATFFENGQVATQTWANPSSYTMTYTLDGAGRLKSTVNSTSSVTAASNASYFPASNPATVSVFTSDSDSFTYNTTTGNMTNFTYKVGTPTLSGNISWNANNTISQLATTDGFFAAGTLTCADSHDDFIRLTKFDCGSGNWGQNYTWDSRDNMNKSQIAGRTGTTWATTYDQGTNRYTGCCSYDANGNVTSDGNQVYFYNEVGKMKSTATSGTPNCGTSGRCMYYDAFDKPVETSNGSNFTERFYAQSGMALLIGASISTGYWHTPMGGTYIEASTRQYAHPDPWGSTRLVSSFGHATTLDVQWTPFGEQSATPQTNANNALYQFQNMLENLWKGVMFDGGDGQFISTPSRWNAPGRFGNWNLYKFSTDSLSLPALPEY